MSHGQIVTGALSLILVAGFSAKVIAREQSAKNTIVGTALSPAHFPDFSDHDFRVFFDEAAQVGSHVTWIFQWGSLPPSAAIGLMQTMAKQRGLKFQLWLSPTTLTHDRKEPDLPEALAGKGFDDLQVRRAYVQEVLALAGQRPDVLGLATEVNLLAQNSEEFGPFVSLAHEAYTAVKRQYPNQTVTISFQWEVMRARQHWELLDQFANSLDVYSFTSYPDASGDPAKAKVPGNYYSSVRQHLPTQRVAISEIGWSSALPSDEATQAAFFARLPEFTGGVGFEFVTLALLHDVNLFQGELERLNHVGIRTIDDAPKKSWETILQLPPMR